MAVPPQLPTSATDPWAYIAVVAVALVIYFVRSMSKRSDYLERALRERDKQVDDALRVLPEVAEVLKKFHAAAGLPEDAP